MNIIYKKGNYFMEGIGHNFDNIIDNIINDTKKTLNLLGSRFLDPDANKGLTELSLQLLLFNNFVNKENIGLEIIEIEKIIETGKRCDLYIKNKDNHILIIEIKYIKISYLEETRKAFNKETTILEKHSLWNKINNDIKKMENKDILKLKRWSDFVKSTKEYNPNKYQSIEFIMDTALNQSENYSKILNNSDWRKIKQYKIHYMVIIGIGFNLIRSKIYDI